MENLIFNFQFSGMSITFFRNFKLKNNLQVIEN